MSWVTVITLTVIMMYSFGVKNAGSVCCSTNFCSGRGTVCGDCTKPGAFACCSIGEGCNLFCCNCDQERCASGACEPNKCARIPGPGKRSTKTDYGNMTTTSQFKMIDMNHDGKCSPEEVDHYMDMKYGKGKHPKTFTFASFDHDKDGFLTMKEIDSKPT